ncbi:MAG: hypothetical protein M2R46_00836 [Verrucomicrobia subdivision 3 bacterium]|nr:hypothetical protein [Limisphaerales bacterium]
MDPFELQAQLETHHAASYRWALRWSSGSSERRVAERLFQDSQRQGGRGHAGFIGHGVETLCAGQDNLAHAVASYMVQVIATNTQDETIRRLFERLKEKKMR